MEKITYKSSSELYREYLFSKKKQKKTFSYKFGNDHFGAKILSYSKNWMFTHLLIPLPCRPFFPGDQLTWSVMNCMEYIHFLIQKTKMADNTFQNDHFGAKIQQNFKPNGHTPLTPPLYLLVSFLLEINLHACIRSFVDYNTFACLVNIVV